MHEWLVFYRYIREAYRYLMELTERESIFQRAEMKSLGTRSAWIG